VPWGEDRRAHSLCGSRHDQRGSRAGQPAGERARGEQERADDEHAAPAEEVAKAATKEEQASEGDRIRVDDPLEVGRGETELVLDGRQCDVDDRHVEHHHQLGKRDDEKGEIEVGLRRFGSVAHASRTGTEVGK